jgi:hypothetical protein
MKTWNTPGTKLSKLLGLSILGHGAKEDKRKLAEVAQNGVSSYPSHCMGQVHQPVEDDRAERIKS